MTDQILSRLEKVKQNGRDKWTACCPVHGDKSPSLSIAKLDGKTVCHCFACGANGVDVAEAVGLSASVLFDDSLDEAAKNRYRKEKLLQEKESDELWLRIYKAAIKSGKEATLKDKREHKKRTHRLASINTILLSL